MCREWPFISSLLVDIANWKIMASVCPGMRIDLDDRTLTACIRRQLAKQGGTTVPTAAAHGRLQGTTGSGDDRRLLTRESAV